MSNEAVQIQKVGTKQIRQVVDLLKNVLDINEIKTFKLLEERIDSNRHLMLLAKAGSRAIGLVECSILQYNILTGGIDRGVIHTLYIDPEFQRRQIASRLIESAGFWFAGNGVDWVVVDVDVTNKELLSFFESAGFETYQIKLRKQVQLPA